ncbi:MAG: transposase [Bryobacteraceae bacterium]|jgi:transposase-like protein
MAKWRRHTVEFKRQVMEQMKTCENIGDLARELELSRRVLYTWKYQLEGRPEPRTADLSVSAEERKEKKLQREIARLKSALAEKALENDFFRSALRRIKEGRQPNIAAGASASTAPSGRGRRSKAV